MQGPEQELIDRAEGLLQRLAPYVVAQRDLHAARDLVRGATYRAIGSHREAGNMRRLAAASERARALLGSA